MNKNMRRIFAGFFSLIAFGAIAASNGAGTGPVQPPVIPTSPNCGVSPCIGRPILFDTMSYTPQTGMKTPNTGIAYTANGAGAASITAGSGSWTSTGNTYLGQLSTSTVQRYGGIFNFNADAGAAFGLISSADPTITLANMVHMSITRTGLRLSYWESATTSVDVAINCSGPIPSIFPLANDGTQYSLYIDLDLVNHTAVVIGPQAVGSTTPPTIGTCQDAKLNNTIGGNLTIWQVGGPTQQWNQMETWSPLVMQANGIVNATGGFNGSVGLTNPAQGYFNYLNLSTSAGIAYVPSVGTFTHSSSHPYLNWQITGDHAQENTRAVTGGTGAWKCLIAGGAALPSATNGCNNGNSLIMGIGVDGSGIGHVQSQGIDRILFPFNGQGNVFQRSVEFATTTPTISTSTFTINPALGNDVYINLVHASCPCTIAAPANVPATGQSHWLYVHVKQSSTGLDTVTWASGAGGFDFGATGAPTLSVTASAVDIVAFIYDLSLAKWVYTGSFLGN